MTAAEALCDRCEQPIAWHFVDGRSVGHPEAQKGTRCARAKCRGEVVDEVLGLCDEHLLRPVQRG